MMNITSTTTTNTAQQQSPRGSYTVEYIVRDGILERVQASLFDSTSTLAEGESPQFKGSITYEHGNLYCCIPYAEGIHHFFSDFEGYLTNILNEIPAVDNTEGSETNSGR